MCNQYTVLYNYLQSQVMNSCTEIQDLIDSDELNGPVFGKSKNIAVFSSDMLDRQFLNVFEEPGELRRTKKTSDIVKNQNNIQLEQNQDEESYSLDEEYTPRKIPKIRKKVKGNPHAKKNNSHERNILSTFFLIIVKFIQKNLLKNDCQKSGKSLSLLRQIAQKKINRVLYVQLFSELSFQNILAHMFKTRYLKRALQLGRSKRQTISEYFKHIQVFQEVFKQKKFPRIKRLCGFPQNTRYKPEQMFLAK